MSFQAVLIPADVTRPCRMTTIASSTDLSAAVGGWAELVRIPHRPDAAMYVNEEGRPLRLAANRRATSLSGLDLIGQQIVGDALVFGLRDDDEDEQDCPTDLAERLLNG